MKSTSCHINPGPINLYSAQATRKLDAIAINEFKIPGYELMQRAGKAAFDHLQNTWPLAKQVLVCCGAGNNAGDGYVIAQLAQLAGLDVKVVSLIEPAKLTGDAKTAWQEWNSLGHQLVSFSDSLLQQTDIVVDALLGTGIERPLEGKWAELVEAINKSAKPVIAVDIPSGLCADTGSIFAHAIRATTTVTFIGLKKGLFTNRGVDCCGEIIFDDLSLPCGVYTRQPEQAQLLDWEFLKTHIKPRKASSHKHQLGHVFVLGGDTGMPGALRMAAEAALRCGAGLVTVISHQAHLAVLLAGRPELMLHATEDGHVSPELLSKASAIVIGPGLTDSVWSRNLLSSALQSKAPKVMDAGALRLLTMQDEVDNNRVLTPHAGEAASLLDETVADIQNARFSSAELLQQQYGGHIVLKGAGSLLQSPGEVTQVCPYGNAGMASAGMGDVLSGVIGSLIAQGYSLTLASRLGLCIHSMAGDMAAEANGPTGLLASDLFVPIRQLINSYE